MKTCLSSIKKDCLILVVLFSISFGCTAEPTTFQILPDRSKQVSLTKEDGLEAVRLNEDAQVVLGSGGLLWARQLVTDKTPEYYDLICQNPTPKSHYIHFYSNEYPWFQVTGTEECKNWHKDLLLCPANVTKSDTKPLACRLVRKKQNTQLIKAREEAAVKLRALKDASQKTDPFTIAEAVVEDYSASVEICRAIHGNQHTQGAIDFQVNHSGKTTAISIVRTGEYATPEDTMAFAGCVAEAIGSWEFPLTEGGYEPLMYTFDD